MNSVIKKDNISKAFFVHWSYFIPLYIQRKADCIGFHMTDLPYGRGGSPLQNLICRGKTSTKISAFQISNKFDSGNIYLKKRLTLQGSAEEIYKRAGKIIVKMIAEILKKSPVARPQTGKPTYYRRRNPLQSELPKLSSLKTIFNFIRMLDAPGYPYAFLKHGKIRIFFRKARLCRNSIIAQANIKKYG